MNYEKTDIDEVADWLDNNKIKYALIPYFEKDADPNERITLTTDYWLEVYEAKAETAIRLKWNVE